MSEPVDDVATYSSLLGRHDSHSIRPSLVYR